MPYMILENDRPACYPKSLTWPDYIFKTEHAARQALAQWVGELYNGEKIAKEIEINKPYEYATRCWVEIYKFYKFDTTSNYASS